ncbi:MULTISPECIES: hypothetical protein [Streptomyces]|uniref:hypothetical protein n=1 Tax=Streptomyces TaxID=1883 RepID=UPI0036697A5A
MTPAHAALLSALAHLAPAIGVDQLAFVARLAQANPHATAQLADFLAQAIDLRRSKPGVKLGGSRCVTSQLP